MHGLKDFGRQEQEEGDHDNTALAIITSKVFLGFDSILFHPVYQLIKETNSSKLHVIMEIYGFEIVLKIFKCGN